MASTSSNTRPSAKLPSRFESLAKLLLPQAIANQTQCERMVEMIDRLMAHGTLTKGQELYMETLVQLVEAYEARQFAVARVRGLDALKHLLEANQMTAADLSRLLHVHASMGSKILKGERSLTVEHIVALAKRFGVRADLFIDDRGVPARRAS